MCFQIFYPFPLHLWNIWIFELTKQERKEKAVFILRVNIFLPNKIVELYAVREAFFWIVEFSPSLSDVDFVVWA